MKIRINNNEKKSDTIYAAEMNFGYTDSNNSPDYELIISIQEFKNYCIDIFQSFRKEEMESTDVYSEDDHPMWNRYKTLQYPDFDTIYNTEKQLLADILLFCAHDILQRLFNTKKPYGISFLLATADKIIVNQDISISGKALYR